MDFAALNERIQPLNQEAMAAAAQRWDTVAKPLGSLGLLEDMVVRLAGLTGGDLDISKRAVVVFCADNGVLEEGVAMTPGEITAMMTRFIVEGRSSVCVMAKAAGADIIPVDMGMFTRIDAPGLRDRRVADGTKNMAKGPAMNREEAIQAIQTGIDIARECKDKGYKLLATGEMGIGNTTPSSAICSLLMKLTPEEATGIGSGLAPEKLAHKAEVIRRSIEVNKPDPNDAIDVLAKIGGLELGAMTGVY